MKNKSAESIDNEPDIGAPYSRRVERAYEALRARAYFGMPHGSAIRVLLTDLHHLSDSIGLDFERIAAQASGAYYVEKLGIDAKPFPEVTIDRGNGDKYIKNSDVYIKCMEAGCNWVGVAGPVAKCGAMACGSNQVRLVR